MSVVKHHNHSFFAVVPTHRLTFAPVVQHGLPATHVTFSLSLHDKRCFTSQVVKFCHFQTSPVPHCWWFWISPWLLARKPPFCINGGKKTTRTRKNRAYAIHKIHHQDGYVIDTLHSITFNYIQLHYTTSYYTLESNTLQLQLHYATFHYTTLHYTTLNYNYTTTQLHSTTPHCTKLHYTTLHSTTPH